PRFSLIIDDLWGVSDDQLKARSLAAFPKLALWLLRDARDPIQLSRSFDVWSSTMLELLQDPCNLNNFRTLIHYLRIVAPRMYSAELRAKIHQLDPRAKEIDMTLEEMFAQQCREEGWEEGRKEGREEGRKEGRVSVLRSLLLFKFRIPTLDVACEEHLHTAT